MTAIAALIGLILAFVAGVFVTRKTGAPDAQILDLTNKIAAKQQQVNTKQAAADAKVKAYEDSLKALNDPNNKPSV